MRNLTRKLLDNLPDWEAGCVSDDAALLVLGDTDTAIYLQRVDETTISVTGTGFALTGPADSYDFARRIIQKCSSTKRKRGRPRKAS